MEIDIDGRRIFCEAHGTGPALVVVHGGMGLDHTYFQPWLDALGEMRTVVYFDQYGHGRSTRGPYSSGLDAWADNIDRLRVAFGLERIVLLGHSFGGYIALEYARRHGATLDGLVLCSTGPAFDYADDAVANAKARATEAQFAALRTLLTQPPSQDDSLRRLWTAALPIYFHGFDPRVGAAMDARTLYSAAGFAHGARCLADFNALPWLGEITAPALVIAGREDWVTPPTQGAARLHAGLKRATLAIFEEAGHFPFIEKPAEFANALRQWLAGLG